MLRKFIRAFAVVAIVSAAACSNVTSPSDDLGEGCEGEAPAEGMVCFGDVWGWN